MVSANGSANSGASLSKGTLSAAGRPRRLGTGGDHRLDPFRIDPLHHMRELAHRRAQQRLLRLFPDVIGSPNNSPVC